MEPITRLTSRTFVIPWNNIDTDQIIPGRFLTLDVDTALGEKLFYDWRHDRDERPLPGEPLNKLDRGRRRILVAGDNFGCGSSREHAVWALTDFGFRAVISTSFADIFRNNALNNGLLAISTPARTHRILVDSPAADVTVDLEACEIRSDATGVVPFEIDPFARRRFLEGADALEHLIRQAPIISEFERRNAL